MTRQHQKLTPRQRAFARAYIGDARRNATEAARIAGYSGSEAALRVRGHECMQHPGVRAYMAELEAPALAKNEVSAERLIQQAAATAFVDPLALYEVLPDGTERPRRMHEIPPETRAAMAHHEPVYADGVFVGWRVRWRDSLKAIELLGRTAHIGLFLERIEHGVSDPVGRFVERLLGQVPMPQDELLRR